MADKQSNGLVLATAGVLVVGSILDYEQKKKGVVAYGKGTPGLAGRLVGITLLVVVLTFTVEQAPEFGKPFSLLILVAALVKYAASFNAYFNQTQGKTK